MTLFIISVREKTDVQYRVEAVSEEEACRMFEDGKAERINPTARTWDTDIESVDAIDPEERGAP